jgi:AcrR family transcriptional regulator
VSPRTLQANQLIRDERRDQILDAALIIFARQGFSGAKISEIAARAGVSYGLIDHYFGKKEDIYIAVVKHAFEGALALLENSLEQPGSAWERLQALTAEWLAGIQKSPEYVLLVNQVSAIDAIPEETKTIFYSYELRSLELQAELVRQAQADGQVAPGDPLALVMVYSAIIQGLAIQCFDHRQRAELLEHFPTVETVLRIFKP